MAEVLEYKEQDTTLMRTVFRQTFIRPVMSRIIAAPEFTLRFGILKKPCTLYRDPKIEFSVIPTKVKNVVYHAFSLKFTGDVSCTFKNDSKEGEEGTSQVWRWESCPSDPNSYSWKKVAGSADLTPSWIHDMIEDSTGTYLDRLQESLGKVVKQSSIDVSGHWETGNLWDLALTIWNILLTGSVVTRNGFDVTIKYIWLNQTQTVNRHIDARVRLPVEGGVAWWWD